jgi:F-type H+-transporting ATPase subunit a
MVTREAWLTKLFNTYLAGPGNALLALFHQTAENPKEPWADFIVMQILVALLIVALLLVLRRSLSVTKPGALQHIFEVIREFINGQAHDQIGHDSQKHTLIFSTLFIFILIANLIGVIPGFVSPTQSAYVTAGCALLAFLYYNLAGLRKNGVWKYTKHFLGPVWWLAWLMLPIEIVSHLARPLSLTIRLFANMYAGEKVTLAFLGLTYLIIPSVFMGLHVFVALLQAYIFVLLTMIYVGGAVAEEH